MPAKSVFTCNIWLALFAIICFSAHAADPSTSATRGTIVLHVVDSAGAPRPEVKINLLGFEQDERYWQDLKQEIRTDATGLAKYDRLSTDQSYLVFATGKDGRVAFRQCIFADEMAIQNITLKIEHPITTVVTIHDASGKPLSGVKLWTVSHTGSNGSTGLDPESLRSCGLRVESSNLAGELVLPPLPPGTLTIRVIHPDCAPDEIKDVAVGSKVETVLHGDAKVKLHLAVDSNEKLANSISIDLRHDPFESPSTLIGQLPWLRPDGMAEVTVAAGNYEWLRLRLRDFIAIPIYSKRYGHSIADKAEPMQFRSGDNQFEFVLKRKVKVTGRVVNRENRHPVADVTIQGEVHANKIEGSFGPFADEWTQADWADTNDKGEYQIKLAAGKARVSFRGEALVANPSSYELNVAADGSTVAPDLLVTPIPKVQGVVQSPDGRPVPNVVVRFRGSMLTFATTPVITDADGKFELQPKFIPEDFQTHEQLPTQTVVAFDPLEPTAADTQIRLDDPASCQNILLKLKPQGAGSLIAKFPVDLSPWAQGIVPKDEKEHLASISLAGKPAPELDGAEWLNTEGKKMSLADFQGKYVLLQFWTTWCGPCHADMPSVKLVYSTYREKGLAVIGVHDNSMPLDAIKQDAAKQQLTYPIVVDRPDGRIIASYKAHGISGYPSYVLIGPDGNVVRDDSTVAGPGLHSFKVEIIRELLSAHPAKPQ
jgi:thiol-disulfide isomerase/thioredoxin